MHSHLVDKAQDIVDLLLLFTASKDIKFQRTAFLALKDYILLSDDNLIEDISEIIWAF